MAMNKRKKKRVLEWWSNLRIDEKDDYMKTVNPKSKNRYLNPSELEKEKMHDWCVG